MHIANQRAKIDRRSRPGHRADRLHVILWIAANGMAALWFWNFGVIMLGIR